MTSFILQVTYVYIYAILAPKNAEFTVSLSQMTLQSSLLKCHS